MSELRDLTIALKAMSKRLTSVEECLLVLVRDSQQQSEWRHAQKNRVMLDDEWQKGQERAIKQVQDTCGAITHHVDALSQQLDTQGLIRFEDVRELKARLRRLEPAEEVTKG